MKYKISTLILLSIAIVLFSCKSDENKLLSIELIRNTSNDTSITLSPTYPPTYYIDTIKNKVSIYVGPDFDLANLNYDVKLSPKAKATVKPSDLTAPKYLEITAENGEIRKYLIIVTKVTGSISILEKNEYFENTTSKPHVTTNQIMKSLSHNFSCAHAKEGLFNDDLIILGNYDKKGVSINLADCGGVLTKDDFFIRLFFEGKSINELAGSYEITKQSPINVALTYMSPKEDENPVVYSSSTLTNPASGKIEIEKLDRENNLVTGTFSNIEFSINNPKEMKSLRDKSTIYYYSSGKFINVPIK